MSQSTEADQREQREGRIKRMQRIFLTGISGAGKTTVGLLTARMLGWRFLDMDTLIEERAKRSVAQLFADYGEASFRQLESEALEAAARQEAVVIATGGGAITSEANRALMRQQGLSVYLATSVDLAWQRIQDGLGQSGAPGVRPLLVGADGQQKLGALYEARKQWYEDAELHLTTDTATPDALARRVVAGAIAHGALLAPNLPLEEMTLDLGRTSSHAIVEWGGLHHLPQHLQALGFRRRAFMITDSSVGPLYSEPLQEVLKRAGIDTQTFMVPAGEASKSLTCFQEIIDWLVEQRAEQQEPIIALGGGVIGDLAGFVAACYQRGVPLIQIPTTLLAQVDAAIGGKTAINHPLGKNLIGAYYQPRLTLVDPACLLTLPERVYREGWAEIIKYGIALDAELFCLLEDTPPVRPQAHTLLPLIIARCIRLKIHIVQQDERDQGQRAILNYGHTFGHALEAITDYTTWLHGEAVAVGMEIAAQIACGQGLLTSQDAERQQALLAAYGLPTTCPDIEMDALLAAMSRDKKVRDGAMRWILPTSIGQANIYDGVPLARVQEAIETITHRHARVEAQMMRMDG